MMYRFAPLEELRLQIYIIKSSKPGIDTLKKLRLYIFNVL